MKRSSLPLLAALLAALLLLTACSGGAAATTSTATTATTGQTTPAGGELEVVMESFAFTPAELTVPLGATVTWTNRHPANHDVVADDGTFASPLLGTGESFSFTFTAAGDYPYHCSIHASMQGTIIVTAP